MTHTPLAPAVMVMSPSLHSLPSLSCHCLLLALYRARGSAGSSEGAQPLCISAYGVTRLLRTDQAMESRVTGVQEVHYLSSNITETYLPRRYSSLSVCLKTCLPAL